MDCRKITVAIISTNADRAGAPLHVQELSIGMSGQAARVVVVFGEDGPVRQALADRGIETYVVPTMRSQIDIGRDLKSISAIKTILAHVRPDIVHAHSSKAGMVGRIAGKAMGIPVVYTIHGWGFGTGRRPLISAIVRTIEFLLRSITSRFIAVSHADRNIGMTSLGISENRIATVHNGTPDTEFRADPGNSRVVAMVARADLQKDYETLFKAIEAVPCELWCIGRGTDSADFMDLAKGLAPSNHQKIRFFGSRSDVPELLSKAAIFVLSSRFEGLPISIIEAMRAGLPVVASDVGGVCELVQEGQTGFLFASGDHQALEQKLRQLMHDDALRKTLGANGRDHFLRNFTNDKMIAKTLSIYSSVLTRGA